MTASYIYPGAHTLSPYITIKGCDKAIEFYKKVFGAKEKGRLVMPNGSISHAEIEIEGSLLMMTEENVDWGNKSPETIGGNSVTLGLYVQDADLVFNRAIEFGATVIMPVDDRFYGDRSGVLLDPFGYRWSIATHKKDISFGELQRQSDTMFGGNK